MPFTISDAQLRVMARQTDELAVLCDREGIGSKSPAWFLQGTINAMARQALGHDEALRIMRTSEYIAMRHRTKAERMERAGAALRNCVKGMRGAGRPFRWNPGRVHE